MLKSWEMKIFYKVHARFFFMLSPGFFFLLKAYMFVEFRTMNFNFTLHFLESYFQFNRKYLFEVILHFLSPSLDTFFFVLPLKRGVFSSVWVCVLGRFIFHEFYSNFFELFTFVQAEKGEKKSKTFRRYVEEQVNIRI